MTNNSSSESSDNRPSAVAVSLKPSGVPWLGDIPEGWSVSKVKSEFISCKRIAGESATNFQRLALTMQGVVKRSKEDANGLQPEQFEGYQVLQENELVFKLIDLQNISTSRVGRSPFTGLVSPAYIILHHRYDRSTRYAEYYFLSMWMHQVFNQIGGDAVRSCIGQNELLNLPFLHIPESEQRAIADFLDERCAAIDAIVEEAKAGIEEYAKWKQSVVFEAVTKGLSPHAKMKDSGVEWIGEVPEGWKVCKTLFALQMPITDGPHTTPELFAEGVPFVSAEAVTAGNGTIDFSHIRGYISEEFYQECCLKYVPKIDDIYMIKSGATTGRVAIVDTGRKFTIWSPLAVFRANPQRVLPRFLFYFLQSDLYQKQVSLAWNFGTQQNIGMRALERLTLLLPPLPEQHAIAAYLDEKCSAIDALIEEKKNLIEDLGTYKKSLIYETVTGKRRVAG